MKTLLSVAGLIAGLIGLGLAPQAATGAARLETATFAGGCFWCMQTPFEKIPGVAKTTVGYTGGVVQNPNYQQVSAGGTGHAEAVDVQFDPAKVTYAQLLDVFWHNIDPLAKDRQFCDVGEQYRSAIFTHGDEQRKTANQSLHTLVASARFNSPIQTQIVDATKFYPAEDYHQDYHRKNPGRYAFYRWNCGRDNRLQELWGAAK